MRSDRFVVCAFALGALFSGLAAHAQAPDCTGVSTVYNTDPNLVGELTTVRVANGLSSPVLAIGAPGDNSRLFIVEQIGRIRLLKDGALQTTPFLDIQTLVAFGGEQGLLGLAFHPDYQTNGWFFVYYTDNAGNQQISRYQRLTDDVASPSSAAAVITVSHPGASNHNGGGLAFSPVDGHLYIGTGDGGGGCDPGPFPGNAQNLNSQLGKMLRLDVDTLPASTDGNPFDGGTAADDAVWSYGLRNPWRWSFDRETGAIYIGDVGQFVWEEIDCSPGTSTGGENYGWVNMEGDHCPNPSCGSQNPCPPANYVAPIHEYNQSGAPACAVTGGYVYRGCRMPDLRGTYFYSDACDDFVNTFRTDAACSAGAPFVNRENDLEPGGGISIGSIVGFGEDNRGELYIVDLGGEVFRIIPELGIMEVSGPGAPLFGIRSNGTYTWENLTNGPGHEVSEYRVYRAIDDATATFTCVHSGTGSSWSGGDPTDPAVGQVFFYVVTARNSGGQETVPGAGSDGTIRTIDPNSPCTP